MKSKASLATRTQPTWHLKWNFLTCFFQFIYSKSSLDVNLSSPDVVNPYLLLNITTSVSEVQGILSNLDTGNSPGVDNLPAQILRTCAKQLSVPLTLPAPPLPLSPLLLIYTSSPTLPLLFHFPDGVSVNYTDATASARNAFKWRKVLIEQC